MPDPVKRALRELPARLSTTVYLADAEGNSYAEIARITGVPIGTVMSQLTAPASGCARSSRAQWQRRQGGRSRPADPRGMSNFDPAYPAIPGEVD